MTVVDNRLSKEANKYEYQSVLDQLDLRGSLDNQINDCFRFMMSVSRTLDLSQVTRDALDIAEQYQANQVSESRLEHSRVLCWQSIAGRDLEIDDPAVAATRAVICLLFPREQQQLAYDELHLFGMFAMNAGAESEQLGISLLAFLQKTPGGAVK